jgi:hypothetical protein
LNSYPKLDTRANPAGFPAKHPRVETKFVTPTNNRLPPLLTVNGPPESPAEFKKKRLKNAFND